MLVDHGFSKETIGQFFAMPAVICIARFDYGVALPAMATISRLTLPLLVVLHAWRSRWHAVAAAAPATQGGNRA